MLDKYGIDLTKLAEKDELDTVVSWREKEREQVMQILSKRRKNNPCLLGSPADIGVTSVIEGLAIRIADGSAPPSFHGKKVISLKKGHLLAGCEEIQFENRLRAIIDEVKQQTDGVIILFVDSVDLLIRLASVTDQLIGALTHDQYQEYIESDSVLTALFQTVDLPEPSIDEMIELLKVVCFKYEAHHHVRYTDQALTAAANLSNQYRREGSLIDKAIDMIDEAGARANLQMSTKASKDKSRVVTKEHIEALITPSPTRLSPKRSITPKNKSKALLNMEKSLQKHVIGQEEAVGEVSRALIRAKVGIRDTRRPIASFLFVGPTGVGKTELANAVAIEYFGAMESMVKLDMSECMERHSVSKLIGSPPGYLGYDEGGHLTNAIITQRKSVVLFDEIEKAHSDIYDILLQLLEDGRLTDGQGNKADFSETIIILTSNIGNKLFSGDDKNTPESLKEKVMEELKKVFRIEILNRLDDVIVFRKLSHDDLREILDIMLEKVRERVKGKKNIRLKISDSVKNKLIEEGYNPELGARPLRRCITRVVEDALVQWIADGDVEEGKRVVIDLDADGEVVRKKRHKTEKCCCQS